MLTFVTASAKADEDTAPHCFTKDEAVIIDACLRDRDLYHKPPPEIPETLWQTSIGQGIIIIAAGFIGFEIGRNVK